MSRNSTLLEQYELAVFPFRDANVLSVREFLPTFLFVWGVSLGYYWVVIMLVGSWISSPSSFSGVISTGLAATLGFALFAGIGFFLRAPLTANSQLPTVFLDPIIGLGILATVGTLVGPLAAFIPGVSPWLLATQFGIYLSVAGVLSALPFLLSRPGTDEENQQLETRQTQGVNVIGSDPEELAAAFDGQLDGEPLDETSTDDDTGGNSESDMETVERSSDSEGDEINWAEEQPELTQAELSEQHLQTLALSYNWNVERDIDFSDVGGMAALKQTLAMEIISPLKEDRERAEAFDLSPPNFLLYGPPGTGKTYLAQAIAGELEYPFVSISGSDITTKWVNESSTKISELFDDATAISRVAGGAVIFLDEIDGVAPSRQGGTHEENRKVVSEFLSQLSDVSDEDILFICATNRKQDVDPAIMRSGRIDRKIHVGKPDTTAREEISKKHLTSRPTTLSEADYEWLGEVTGGWTGADIASAIEDAARIAAFQDNSDSITRAHIEQAVNQRNQQR